MLEAWLAAGSAFAMAVGLVAAGAFFPILLIPGIGLVFAIGAGAAGALAGNKLGKLAGLYLYDNNFSQLSDNGKFSGLNAL